MPTFYFHILDGFQVRDARGLELPNVKAARRYANELAEGFSLVAQKSNESASFVEVVDESGNTIARLKLPR